MSVDQKYLDMAKDLTRNDFAVSKFSKFGAAPPAEEETVSSGGMPIVTGLEAYLGLARELTNIKTQPIAMPKRKIPFQEMGEEFAGNRAERLLRQYNSPSPYQHTDSYGQERVRAVAAIETPRIFLQAPFTEAELQGALNAIYKQVFGNTYVMESERPRFAESQLRDGQLTVRGFIRELVKTEVYKVRFFYKSSQNRFIELNFKLLLGRAPYSQQEISEHVLRYNTEGYDAEINSYLDSDEYSANFGEDTVPYYRGFNYQVGQTGPAFSRMIDLYDGYATSDSDRAQIGQVARLTEGLSKPVKQDTPPPEQVDWIAPTFVTSDAYTRYQFTVASRQNGYRTRAASETAKVELQVPCTNEDFQVALRAIYRQVLGNAYVMESERPTVAESKLKEGTLSVREFIRELAKSETYMNRFLYKNVQTRFVELNYKALLGRAPYNQQEISKHIALYNAQGYEAEIDSYLDSEEYLAMFGENTVPYYQGFKTQAGQSMEAFERMSRMYDGYAGSDRSGQSTRLAESLGLAARRHDAPSYTYTPIPYQSALDQSFAPPMSYERSTYKLTPYQQTTPFEPAGRPVETAQVTLQFPCTNEDFQVALRAIYRQIFGNAYVMESERSVIAESKLKEGKISVRGFIRELVQGETYMNRFLYRNAQTRFVELNYKLLLGRAPYNRQEISEHIALYNAQGYEAEMNSYLDSEEYLKMFGEDTVPFIRGSNPRTNQTVDAFNRNVSVHDDLAGSAARVAEKVDRWEQMLAASYSYVPEPYRPSKRLETAKVELRAPFSEEEFQVLLRAIYRQVLGNTNLMESERPTVAESQLRNGELTVRGFINRLANSEAYMNRFFHENAQILFIELNFKLLLGRAPYDQAEVAQHVALYSAQGYEAEIDSYLNSEEYLSAFGEDTVPYYRGFETQTGQRNDAFNRTVNLYDGYAGSALSGQAARLAERVSQQGGVREQGLIQARAVLEGPKVELQAPCSEEEFQVALRAIYRQILGNSQLMESERPIATESQLRNGELTVRGFIARLVKSEVYMNRFFHNSSQSRFIELNFKLLLGRAPYDQEEVARHVERYSAQGYGAEIDSYLDSEEYLSAFGEDIVPYYRGFDTQTGQSNEAFNRMVRLYDGFAGSDTVQIPGEQTRSTRSLGRSVQLQKVEPVEEVPTPTPYEYQPTPYQPSKRLEPSKVELRAPFSEEEFQVALRAIYRQIFGGTNLLESERPIATESQLRNGELTVRGFIGSLVKSEVYMSRFFANSAQNRFIEQNFRILLGRVPHDQAEIAQHVELYSAQGYEAEIDSYLNSEEYLENFGEDTVPYYRDFATQTSQSAYAGIPTDRMSQVRSTQSPAPATQKKGTRKKSATKSAATRSNATLKSPKKSPQVELRAPFSEEEFQVALRAIYTQIFGGTVLESEQPIAAESQLRNGELTVRGFIGCLVKSEVYMNRFFANSAQNDFVEQNFKLLLGRAPHDQAEIAQHVELYSTQGYEAEIDSYLNSEEYLSAFGEDTVPYYRSFET